MKGKARKLISSDGYLPIKNYLLEFDEVQHFTPQRLLTLGALTAADRIRFDLEFCRSLCRRKQHRHWRRHSKFQR
jgi:hypothetical protein